MDALPSRPTPIGERKLGDWAPTPGTPCMNFHERRTAESDVKKAYGDRNLVDRAERNSNTSKL